MLARLRRLISPPPVAVSTDHQVEILEVLAALRREVADVRADTTTLRTRLDETDVSLRFMVGEVSQLAQKLLGLALGTHHSAVSNERVTTQLQQRLDDLGRQIGAERDAIFASNESNMQHTRRIVERLSELTDATSQPLEVVASEHPSAP